MTAPQFLTGAALIRGSLWLWERIANEQIRRWLEKPVVEPLLRDFQTRMLGVGSKAATR